MENTQREYPIVGPIIGDMLDDMLFYKAVDKVKDAYRTLKEDLRIPAKKKRYGMINGRMTLYPVPVDIRSCDERRFN